jgi:hypothetical protein
VQETGWTDANENEYIFGVSSALFVDVEMQKEKENAQRQTFWPVCKHLATLIAKKAVALRPGTNRNKRCRAACPVMSIM